MAQLCRRMGFQSRVRRLQDGRHTTSFAPRSFERSASAPHTAMLPVESGNSRVSAKAASDPSRSGHRTLWRESGPERLELTRESEAEAAG